MDELLRELLALSPANRLRVAATLLERAGSDLARPIVAGVFLDLLGQAIRGGTATDAERDMLDQLVRNRCAATR